MWYLVYFLFPLAKWMNDWASNEKATTQIQVTMRTHLSGKFFFHFFFFRFFQMVVAPKWTCCASVWAKYGILCVRTIFGQTTAQTQTLRAHQHRFFRRFFFFSIYKIEKIVNLFSIWDVHFLELFVVTIYVLWNGTDELNKKKKKQYLMYLSWSRDETHRAREKQKRKCKNESRIHQWTGKRRK